MAAWMRWCRFAGLLEAVDGTRTHDVLHGKQYVKSGFQAEMRVCRARRCDQIASDYREFWYRRGTGLRSPSGLRLPRDSDSHWTLRADRGCRRANTCHTVARRSEASACSVSDPALASRPWRARRASQRGASLHATAGVSSIRRGQTAALAEPWPCQGLRPELVPGVEVIEVLPTVYDLAALELED